MSAPHDLRFDELPVNDALGMAHAWDQADASLGTIERALPPERVLQAARLVRDGTVLTLNLPVTEPDPPLFGREPLDHTILSIDRNNVDDRLDRFYPQASSQWDGLRHVRAREHGFFGGWDGELEPGPGALGVERWAETGIVGRGVLLDVVALREAQGRDFDPLGGETIEASDLEAALECQGAELTPGTILLIRTGWIERFRALPDPERRAHAATPRVTGLAGSEDVARFLWDAGLAAVAADNPTLEVAPGDPARGSLHRRLIPMLGFAVGELLDLHRLAALSAQDGRWDFFFVAVPLNLPGGIGSPANAVAIR